MFYFVLSSLCFVLFLLLLLLLCSHVSFLFLSLSLSLQQTQTVEHPPYLVLFTGDCTFPVTVRVESVSFPLPPVLGCFESFLSIVSTPEVLSVTQ
mmetsp:Transcript_754/g.2347  ORF Transcript_754/g.2347 Transcript_754/m.2347 type:complete len:95 (-) Transcript_754:1099-1383(-)